MPNFSDKQISPFFTVPEGEYKFRFDGQHFSCVYSSCPAFKCVFWLSEFLSLIDVIVDDDTQFARIIRFHEWTKTTLTYRAYNQFMVQININRSNIK